MYGKRKSTSQSGPRYSKKGKRAIRRFVRKSRSKRGSGQRGGVRKPYGRKRTSRGAVPSRLALSLALGTPRSYLVNGASIVTSAPGEVGYTFVTETNTPTDVQRMFDLASSQQGIAQGVGNLVQKTCTSEMLFTNQDRSTVWMKIYRCVARKDMAATGGLAETIYMDGWADLGQPGNRGAYGQSPFYNHKFTSLFRISGVTSIKLEAGCTAKRSFKDKGRQNWNRSHTTGGHAYYGGRSVIYLVEVTSAPVNDSFYTSQVTLGSAKVVIVFKRNYQYTFVPSNAYSFTSQNTLITSISENIMEKDGDIVPDMHA